MDSIINTLSSPLQRIGAGFCGSVWTGDAADGDADFLPFCIKREDGGPGRSMHNEQALQSRVNERILQTSEDVFLVPRCHGYLAKDDEAWVKLLGGFPSSYQACNAMVSDTIQPILAGPRKAMIDRYCPSGVRQEILSDEKNRHCLLRLYLGRRRQPSQLAARRRFFTLRNLPLHLDQVEELQLPTLEYAHAMARGLAFMHWSVGIDGNDVEFVLAPPRDKPITTGSGTQRTWSSSVIGEHSLWLLDFDCCRELTVEDCVDQVARSFWRNDPFYPRPNGEDQALWGTFVAEYERASLDLIPDGPFGGMFGDVGTLMSQVIKHVEDSREAYIRG